LPERGYCRWRDGKAYRIRRIESQSSGIRGGIAFDAKLFEISDEDRVRARSRRPGVNGVVQELIF
jgi:hypothetical protein